MATKEKPAEAGTNFNFEEDAGLGFENVTAKDMALPFLAILQKLSPQVDESNGKYLRGSKPGMIMNTVTKELFGEVTFVPVGFRKLYVEWQPRESGGGFVAMHQDETVLAKTKKNEKGQDQLPNGNLIVTTAYHFGEVLYPDGKTTQAVVGMSSTQLKKSREWISLMRGIVIEGSLIAPMYRNKYRLTTVKETNKKGEWFGWKIENLGPVNDVKVLEVSREFGRQVQKDALLLTSKAAEASAEDTPADRDM